MAREWEEANGFQRAEEVGDARRERIWQEALRTYPGLSAYAKRAAPQRISVFVLHLA